MIHKKRYFKNIKLYLLGITPLLLVIVLFSCSLFQEDDSFRFIFMTDIHLQPELRAVEGFTAAIKHVNGLKPRPDFVITGGDLVRDVLKQNYGRADSLYNLFIEKIKLFQMPVRHCIGNHEIFGLFPESGVAPEHLEFGKKMFMNRLGQGRTYRSFDCGKWHFILLDAIGTTPERKYIGLVDSIQLVWLEKDLKETGEDRSVVLTLHIPLYSVFNQFRNGSLAVNDSNDVVINSDEVWKICQPYKIRLILQGHLHVVEELIWKGTHFVTGGAVCGAWWKGPRYGFPEGFVIVDVKGEEFTWKYETFGWKAERRKNGVME